MKALISVSDKTGVIDLARSLTELGVSIISTGGTETALKDEGITVTNISDVTGFPECLDGRVKTLHPHVHAGILAKRDDSGHMSRLMELNINTIDIVIVNLYPFKQTVEKECPPDAAIENIDIGGPAMLRSAAKNYKHVSVIIDPTDYPLLVDELRLGKVSEKTNFYFAAKAFEHTAAYDSLISAYMREKAELEGFPEKLTLTFELLNSMRYGENPHQKAAFYSNPIKMAGTVPTAVQIHGKELSYNNINDTNAALEMLKEFSEPTVIAVKHANPCGAGSASAIYEAFVKAYEADKISIFGGIIAANREIDEKTAIDINKMFIEIVIAPSFSERALGVLTQKQNIRLLSLDNIDKKEPAGSIEMKRVAGGLLVQEINAGLFNDGELLCVTTGKPTDSEMDDLRFAMKLVKHVKSNGIVIAKNKQTVGIGVGQTSRIRACKQAIESGKESLGDDATKGAVLASDAFFPIEDCVREAAKAGISAIIQPGGSIGDKNSVVECNKNNISMVFTGIRHFKH